MQETSQNPVRSNGSEPPGFVKARIDQPHEAARELPVTEPGPGEKVAARIQPRRARQARNLDAATVNSKTWAEQLSEPVPRTQVLPEHSEPTAELSPTLAEFEELAPLAARHADDIAWHLTERLQAVERRELNLGEYQTRLQQAESAAQAWVMECETNFQTREREVTLREDELSTRLAAAAAVEIATQEEQLRWRAAWEEQIKALEKREAQCAEMETRLHAESYSLQAAMERFQAEKLQHEEQFRARRQQWELLCSQDRAQLDRLQQNITRHRQALEAREQQLRALEANLAVRKQEDVQAERLRLETERLRMEAAQERRIATEQRWIAGRLWARLMDANLVSNDELALVLKQVRHELENTYRRERESLERVRQAMLNMAQHIVQPASEPSPQQPVLKRPTVGKRAVEVSVAGRV
jgi:hypothetical protein